MGFKLCTAEKPSVAADIAEVIGANQRENGYFIGNGYIVTWALGHLTSLAEPEEYGYMSQKQLWDKEHPENKEKALNELPIVPDEFKLVPTMDSSARKQFIIMKNLMQREDVDYIIDCGDMGPEGHILQWMIREVAGCKKPVKRFCATSYTEKAIKDAMNNLVSAERYKRVIEGEFCKKRADWMMGISCSRCASILYNSNINVGRVQSPTLYFVVKRYYEVESFKPHSFYKLKIKLNKELELLIEKAPDDLDVNKDEENRMLDVPEVMALANRLTAAKYAIVEKFETNKKKTGRPLLYDIIELEKDGVKLFGYAPDETLSIAQSLYEKHKIMTYPRTDSRYITSDLEKELKERLDDLIENQTFPENIRNVLKQVQSVGYNIDGRLVKDEEVTDHHALIMTDRMKQFDFDSLNQKEKNILLLVLKRIITSVSQDHLYEETVLGVNIDGFSFSTKGKRIKQMGWIGVEKLLLEKEDDIKDTLFPDNLEIGKRLLITGVSLVNGATTKPKYHTEDTLLTAMQNAGSQLHNGQILKGRGIGTQSTRAAIINELIEKKYIVYQKEGKIKYLVPSKIGVNIIKLLPSELYSPQITADWEERISKIVDGSMTPDEFLKIFEDFLQDKIEYLKNNKKDLNFKLEKPVFDSCPWCGGRVYKNTYEKEGNKNDYYTCENSKVCSFTIFANNKLYELKTGKKLSDKQIHNLIKNRKISFKAKSMKGTEYKANLYLVHKCEDGKYKTYLSSQEVD